MPCRRSKSNMYSTNSSSLISCIGDINAAALTKFCGLFAMLFEIGVSFGSTGCSTLHFFASTSISSSRDLFNGLFGALVGILKTQANFIEARRKELRRVPSAEFLFEYFSRIDLEYSHFLNNQSFFLIIYEDYFSILLEASDISNSICLLYTSPSPRD